MRTWRHDDTSRCFADGPDTVGSRTVQIETGLTVDGDPSGVSVPTLLRIGVRGDALELRIESGVSRFANGDRDWTPVGIGVKARLRNVGVAVRRGRARARVVAASLETSFGDVHGD